MRKLLAGVACAAVLAGGAATAFAASATHAGNISVLITENTLTGPSRDVVTGAITDYGTDHSLSETQQKVVLSKGSFVVASGAFDKSFRFKFDKTSCVARGTARASGETLSAGTGAYAGITGSLTLKATFIELARRTASGACANPQHSKPLAQTDVITATGHVSY